MTFNILLQPAGIAVDGVTTVNATLTANIGTGFFGQPFTATFGAIGPALFEPPDPIFGNVGAIPTCILGGSVYSCPFQGLTFMGPNTAAGTFTFTAAGTLPGAPTQQSTFDATIPEPATLALISLGLLGIGVARRRARH